MNLDIHTRIKKSGLHPINEDEEYLNSIYKYRKRKLISFVLIIVLILLIIAASIVLYYFHTYEGYKVLEEQEHSDSTYVSYEAINDLQLRYTKDGISLFENGNKTVWSATYEMQSPLTDICGDYIIVYERNGNKIYLFNTTEALYTFESTMPIKMARVSEKGTIAIILEEEEQIHRLKYIDSKGENIAEGRAFFNERGYPMDMSLSYDGYKLCVSYYVIDGVSAKTNLIFYSFDDIGDSNVDNIVTQNSYDDTIVPTVRFLKDGSLIAFSDSGMILYSKDKKPEVMKILDISGEIASVFYDDKNFGTVTIDEQGRKTLTVYGKNGKTASEIPFDFDYTDIRIKNDTILMYNTTKWRVYMKNGYLKAQGEYTGEITQMVPAGFNRYTIVGSNKIEKIKLAN